MSNSSSSTETGSTSGGEKKMVMTVTGEIPADSLGITLPHEHLHMRFDVAACPPPTTQHHHVPSWPSPEHLVLAHGKGKEFFTLPRLGLVRQYPYSVPYNLALDDEDSKAVMVHELLHYKALGGVTLVENTTTGINRNLRFLKELSESTGVNIIAGTGYYIASAQSDSTLQLTVEEMYGVIMKELTEGDDENGIRAGVVGEIGSSWPIHPFERRVIEAVAAIQRDTRKPVTFHPGRHPAAAFEILRLFSEAGGEMRKVVMSHLDRTLVSKEELLEFAALGAYNQFDLFGTECSYYQIQPELDMPSDAERVVRLGWLKEEGHLSKILLSHDLHTKHRLLSFGGHGYGHLLQNVVPKFRLHGWSQKELDEMMVVNPRRWLIGGNG